MKIKEIPLENRPRERLFREGASALSSAELLAIVLQSGTKQDNVIDVSNRLLSEYGLEQLNVLSLTELMKINGIGLAKACKLLAAFELSKRVSSGRICEKVISSPSDIAKYYMEKLKDKKNNNSHKKIIRPGEKEKHK